MSSWSRLVITTEPRVRPDAESNADEWLSAKSFLPALWPALIEPATDRVVLLDKDVDDDGIALSHVVFTTTIGAAQYRLERLWQGAKSDPTFSILWEASERMLDYLTSQAPGLFLTLDADELCQMDDVEGTTLARIESHARLLAACGEAWSQAAALEVWRDFGEGDVARDTIATLRWTGCSSPREALCTAALGWPTYQQVTSFRAALGQWAASGPPRPQMRSVEHDAQTLLHYLQHHQIATVPSERGLKWVLRYLASAAKHRTVDALRLALETAATTGIIAIVSASDDALEGALKALNEPSPADSVV